MIWSQWYHDISIWLVNIRVKSLRLHTDLILSHTLKQTLNDVITGWLVHVKDSVRCSFILLNSTVQGIFFTHFIFYKLRKPKTDESEITVHHWIYNERKTTDNKVLQRELICLSLYWKNSRDWNFSLYQSGKISDLSFKYFRRISEKPDQINL